MAQEPTYDVTSTPAAAAWEAGGTPQHTRVRTQGIDMGDEGMIGAHKAGRMTLANAHPYQSHSVGYEDSPAGTQYVNHGIDAVHIKHGRRDKNPESHPPLGLIDYEPTEHNSKL